MTTLAAAFASIKPDLAAFYDQHVRRTLGSLQRELGPALRGIGNSRRYSEWQEIARVCRAHRIDAGMRVVDYFIDEAKLAAAAAEYAETAAEAFRGKIEAKLGEIEGASFEYQRDGIRFVITGFRAGRRVMVEQTVVVKAGPRSGRLFAQFPARIYLDGKFTPEAAYKRAFA